MKKTTKTILTTLGLLSITTYLSATYFSVNYASKRLKKEAEPVELNDNDELWLKQQNIKELEITSYDQLKLKALLIEASIPTDKLIICVHGYHSNNQRQYKHMIRFFHDLGYNILLPNNRAHGNSEGQYIGFGWLDRIDIINWIYYIKDYYSKPLQIALHGISMGGATVMCVSGEQLPKDVKCIIEDCGYTTLYKQLKHVSKYHNKRFRPFLFSSALMSKLITGFSFFKVKPIKQVKKAYLPIMFIHGEKDDYVPSSMAYQLFKACPSKKELLIIKNATHATSYRTNTKLYETRVKHFLSQYIK